jgi:hypothetical protein
MERQHHADHFKMKFEWDQLILTVLWHQLFVLALHDVAPNGAKSAENQDYLFIGMTQIGNINLVRYVLRE